MKKTIPIFGIIFCLTFMACTDNQTPKPDDTFVLKGEVEGIENGTDIFLMLDNERVDSTKIIDDRFAFTGEIQHPKLYNLFVQDPPNYTGIWLESNEIEFEASKGEFSNAKIGGSKTQKKLDALTSRTTNYRNRRDSLRDLSRDPNIDEKAKEEINDQLKVIYSNHLSIEKDFIRKNPDSYVSIWLIDFYSKTLGSEKTKELYITLNDSLKSSSYGKNIERFLSLNKRLKVGDRYVDFAMTNDKDEEVRLSAYEGNLILLDFWASWCAPCIKEYPALKKAYAKFHEDGFEIISVSEDREKERWLKAIDKNDLNWINLWQEDGNEADPYLIYGISGIPDNFLIDENGTIVARNLRGEELIKTIESTLKKASR